MSFTWFKLHHDIADDIKLRRFTPQEKWAWVALLCLGSKASTRGVIEADDEDISEYCEFNSTQDWLYYRDKLIAKGMLDFNGDGNLIILHWQDRQYDNPSDKPEAVKSRVAKHRAIKKAVSNEAVTTSNEAETTCNEDVTTQTRSDQTRSDPDQTRSDQTRSDSDQIERAYESQTNQGIHDFYKRVKEVYNENKPDLWASLQSWNDGRTKPLDKIRKECGDDETLEHLRDALKFASQDTFWGSKPMGLDNLLRQGRIVEFAEKWAVVESSGGIVKMLEDPSQREALARHQRMKRDLLKFYGEANNA